MDFPFLKWFFAGMRLAAVVLAVLFVCYLAALGYLVVLVWAFRGDGTGHTAQDWDAWRQEHVQHCVTCDKAFNHFDEANTGMCQEAFDKFKEFARKR